jgi:hypothetical protein
MSGTGRAQDDQTAGWSRSAEVKDDVLDGFAVREVRYRYRFDP